MKRFTEYISCSFFKIKNEVLFSEWLSSFQMKSAMIKY